MIKHRFRLTLLLLATIFSLFGNRSTIYAVDSTGLPNFHIVAPGIYRGGAPSNAGLVSLKKMGIHTIIDLRGRSQSSREKPKALAMGFTWINLQMGSEPPTQKQVNTLLETLKRAPGEPIFIHCQHGADRTGCMIGIYRVAVQHWDYNSTYKEMRKYGFKPYYKKLANAVRERVTTPSPAR